MLLDKPWATILDASQPVAHQKINTMGGKHWMLRIHAAPNTPVLAGQKGQDRLQDKE
jgi:hypothetical protein